jgi:hypothetical protein
MNRLFLKFIFYSFIWLYLIAYEGNQISLASSKQEKQPESLNKKPTKQVVSQSPGKNSTKRSNPGFELVPPPPPPEQPSFLDLSNMPNLSTSFNLFNDAELKQKLTHLKVQILNAQDCLNENNVQLNEAKEKSQRFSSLYTEGVVSRKELEAAEKAVSHREHLSAEAKGNLEDLQMQEKAVFRRLDQTKKGDKGTKHASKNKMAKNEKHK